jgi:hypothetical protein
VSESEAVSRAEYDRVCAELAASRSNALEAMNQIVHLTSKLTIAQGDLEAIRRTAPETLSHANCATCAAAHDRHLPPVYATRNP